MTARPPPSEKDKKRFQRAMKLLNDGQSREAIHLFDKVRKTWGDDPDIWYLIGLAHGKLGKMRDVERVSLKALEMQPDHFGALCNLANAQLAMGDTKAALENYRKSLEVKPNEPSVCDNYGRALTKLGRCEDAIEHFTKILQHNQGYAPAYASLAEAYVEAGFPEKAFEAYRKALHINPRLTEVHLGIGHLYICKGDYQKAEHHYHEALQLQPALVDAYIGLGNMHRHRGEFSSALDMFAETAKFVPNHPYALSAKADTLQRMGDDEGAYKLLCELNDRNQITPVGVEVFSRVCQKFNVCDYAMELIETALASTDTHIAEKPMLCFSAGSLMDKLGHYDKAFAWFREANDEIALQYDKDNQHIVTDQLIHHFSKESMAILPRAGTRSTRPIFILGMPRSGTTLIEQILASNPDVYGAGELTYVEDSVDEIREMKSGATDYWATHLAVIGEQKMTTLANRYLEDINKLNCEARYVTDKMPHNFLRVGLINLMFPEARIIHCRRNPLDNCLSIYFQNFHWSHNYATKLENIAHFYSEYRRLMQHWEQVTDIQMLNIEYEDMIENPEAISRQLLEFCALDWHDSVMDFHKSERPVATASFEQVRQPIYKTSRDRWKNYEQYIGPLRELLSVCSADSEKTD